MPLVSRRAYAALHGVSEGAVRKAIAAGKIPLVDGMIDPEIADASWMRNRDAGQQSKLAAAIGETEPTPPPPPPMFTLVPPPAATPACSPSAEELAKSNEEPKQQAEYAVAPLTAARIANTETSTAIKEITRRKLEGSLLEVEEVERTWGQVLQALKDRLRLMPDNLAPALAACTEEAECRSLVMREVLDALGAVSRSVAGMVA